VEGHGFQPCHQAEIKIRASAPEVMTAPVTRIPSDFDRLFTNGTSSALQLSSSLS
jgi:hypothetical protein